MSEDVLAPARHVIGTRYVESVKAYILELTGLLTAKKVTGPDTREFIQFQVRIDVDQDGIITGLRNC